MLQLEIFVEQILTNLPNYYQTTARTVVHLQLTQESEYVNDKSKPTQAEFDDFLYSPTYISSL